MEAYLAVLYPQDLPAPLRIIRINKGDVTANLSEILQQGACLHVIMEADPGIGRAWKLVRLARLFGRHRLKMQIIGLAGTVEHPTMVVQLRRNIMQYVQTVSFRGADSPVRVWLKQLASYLPGGWTWRGPLVLVGSATALDFDRFTVVTGNRQISFLFRDDKVAPWAVQKSGAHDELTIEWSNHERARQLLGSRIPALLEFAGTDDTRSLSLEYVTEKTLVNVVASHLFNRRQVFVREALGQINFCREVYHLLAHSTPIEPSPVTAAEVQNLLKGMAALLLNASEAQQLSEALHRTVGVELPRIIQHGDFCVRNILIADGSRGRVLIDWEDLQERRWPLVDFVMLRLTLKEVFSDLFKVSLHELMRIPAIADGFAELETDLSRLLELDAQSLRSAKLLSLACLCRQNLLKQRLPTAQRIFADLVREVHQVDREGAL